MNPAKQRNRALEIIEICEKDLGSLEDAVIKEEDRRVICRKAFRLRDNVNDLISYLMCWD